MATTTHPAETAAIPADLGLAGLRVVFGGLIAAHGTQKLFGWFDGPGWRANADTFETIGYRPGEFFGTLAGLAELTGGLLLVLGLVTPLAGAIVLGTMINAVNATWSGGLLTGQGYEAPLLYGVVAAVLAFTGAGRFSLDRGRSWERPGIRLAGAAAALGVGAAIGTLILKALL